MDTRPLTKKHFDKLSEYGLRDIPPDSCMCLYFRSGETILREGMPISWLAIVVSGKAKVCSTSPNGKDLILCYYVSGGMIGDIEFMAGLETATANLIAISDFECIAIPYRKYGAVLKRNMAFLNKLGNELSLKLVRSSRSFVSAALYSGEERLCSYILQTSHNNVFSDILTDVSCSVGISYRHIFRLLNQLCEEGVLEKRENGYRITDRDGLIRRSPHPVTEQDE
ncbi:cyclic nucleotide-binding domain-containing protein [Breznakiella homolactica]|uniref:Cyclic nucleotide-binding domain-containing protein n=1 Tax=Breznakiella homolactica TaxID=2798577 RepID=A0A7T7XLR2_9SPIR|nr:cyclic nucleotide-binding domain-containing protein [Breznakiella homolactica]QQO08686.1 cyclic nucleotide-binding domain-containing protein [Breznakiella homolactica]